MQETNPRYWRSITPASNCKYLEINLDELHWWYSPDFAWLYRNQPPISDMEDIILLLRIGKIKKIKDGINRTWNSLRWSNLIGIWSRRARYRSEINIHRMRALILNQAACSIGILRQNLLERIRYGNRTIGRCRKCHGRRGRMSRPA